MSLARKIKFLCSPHGTRSRYEVHLPFMNYDVWAHIWSKCFFPPWTDLWRFNTTQMSYSSLKFNSGFLPEPVFTLLWCYTVIFQLSNSFMFTMIDCYGGVDTLFFQWFVIYYCPVLYCFLLHVYMCLCMCAHVCICVCVCVCVCVNPSVMANSWQPCNPMGCSPPGSSVYWISRQEDWSG